MGQQESDIRDHCTSLITERAGRRPTGHVAPWWEFSRVTNELLLERGITYDHSLMHRDFEPYYACASATTGRRSTIGLRPGSG